MAVIPKSFHMQVHLSRVEMVYVLQSFTDYVMERMHRMFKAGLFPFATDIGFNRLYLKGEI